MKLYQYLTLLTTLCLVSCQKYVDIKKSGSQSFLETASDCQLILDNYDLFNTNYPIDGEISADDYYLDEQRYNSDQISIEDRNLYSWKSDALRESSQHWVNSYNKIYHANLVLETVQALEGKDPVSVLNPIKGSALFLRAYAFWNLVQLYAKPYTATAQQEPGLPVHRKSDINDTPGRGTLKETYDSIISDLKEATDLLSPTSTIASRPNRAAAYAMLARVYLSMEDYPNALISAKAALAIKNSLIDFNTLDKQSFAPFQRFNDEVLFHSTIFYQNGTLEPGYGYEDLAIISPEIIAGYADNDLRKVVYVKENLDVPNPSGTFRFVGNYEGAVGSAKLFNGLAVDELFLISAECNARAGNVPAAMEALNTLLRTRWISGTFVNFAAANSKEALSIILAERRKELLMRGLRWTDLRRLNHEPEFAKVLSRKGGTITYTLPPNDARYTLLIPQEVITNSKLAQNNR